MNGKDMIKKIEQVLDERVRPDLRFHEGGIQIVGLCGSVLYVRLLGQCRGCPSAELTMEALVRAELKDAFPELTDVVLVSGVSDSLIDEAKEILRRRHA